MQISSIATFQIYLNEATTEEPEQDVEASWSRIWGEWVYPRAAASVHSQDLGRQAVVQGSPVSLQERGMLPPPLPSQHGNPLGCQEEAGFCSKQGNATPLVELEFRLWWTAGN